MSSSKCYTSTTETTNAARLARLILGPCTDVLREILKTEVSPSDLSKKVKEFIDNIKTGNRNPLNRLQSEIIFPKPTKQYNGDYSDLDISLLYLLLRKACKIPPHLKGWGEIPNPGDRSVAANIERIRLIRNQHYGHAADLSLSHLEFRQEWRNIRDIVVELEQHLGTTTVYQDAINTIKTCSMDPEQEKKYIDLLGDIKELHTAVDDVSNKMQSIQRELVLHDDPRVARKIETTKKMITKHFEEITPLFVKTRAFDQGKDLLEANGYIVIKGNPGTGKTTIAKILMKELMEEGKSPLQLYKFTDLYENVSPSDGIVVLIDNVFGELSLSSNDVQEFIARSEMVKVLIGDDINSKSNSLILTVRNDIYQDFVSQGNEDTFFLSSMVDLSSKTYELQEDEILQFADKYDLSKYMEKKEIVSKVSEMPLSIGFPQCCKLVKNTVIKEDVPALLLNPAKFLRANLKRRMKNPTTKTAVLVYILLSGGEVDFELIDNFHLDLEMKRASLEFIGLKSSCINDFQSSLNCFDEFRTIRDTITNSIKFSHSSVQESLFHVLFYFDPIKMIQNCHHSLLQKLTTSRNPNSLQVVIGQDLFDDVARRIAKIIAQKSAMGYSFISLLELWNDSNFLEHLLQTEQCISNFTKCRDINGDSMMVHFSKAGNKRWVEHLLPNSDQRQRYRSLNAACSKNHPNIVTLILSFGVKCDLQTCFYAVQSGNLELLLQICEFVDLHQVSSSLHPNWGCIRQSLLQEICLVQQTQFIDTILEKYPFLVGIKDSQGSNALQSAASSGDKHAFNLLLKFGFDPYEKDRDNGHTVLTCACQEGRLGMVKYLIERYPALLHNHIDRHGKSLLHWSAFCGKIDMFEYILDLFENENKISSLTSGGIKPDVYGIDNSSNSILHAACAQGHYDMCKNLVSRYPELLNLCDNDGVSVLHSAALGGNVPLFQYLSSKGLNINATNYGETVLHMCCRKGREEMCKYLLKMHLYLIHVRDNGGSTALHSACIGGSIKIVSFLVKKGLDVNALTNDGKNILHIASLHGKYEVCEYLLENYPQLLDVMDMFSKTVLDETAWGGNVQFVKMLIEKEIDIKPVAKKGEIILHQCCRSKELEMCEYLVNEYPELLKRRDYNGWTVLHSACCGGSVEIVAFLFTKGLDFNALSNDGESILHIACLNGKYEVCEYLVENHPQLLDVRDKFNNTVLHDAAWGGNVHMVKLLIDKGMDIKAVNKSGETILHKCCCSNKIEICEFLVNQYPCLLEIRDNDGWTVLHSACSAGSKEILSFLIKKDLDITALSNDGESILHIAFLNGENEVFEYLVENHPHLLDVRDNFSDSVLHDVAWEGNVRMIKLLIEKGLDIKSVTKDGKTILHKCCRSREIDMCEFLVNKYPDLLEIRDNDGWTVLHSACEGGSVEIVCFLIKKGLDINAMSYDNLSSLHVACLNSNYKVCDYLFSKHPNLLDVKDSDGKSVIETANDNGDIDMIQLLIKHGVTSLH